VIHRPHMFRLPQDRPVLILIVDLVERVDPFLTVLDEMVQEGLVVTWDVMVEKYKAGNG